jgi:acyl carrier protein
MPESDLEQKLIEALEGWVPSLAGRVQAETPLFISGELDSLALFNLLTWIEEQIGSPVDAGSLDPVREWSTVGEILRYIERRRSAP